MKRPSLESILRPLVPGDDLPGGWSLRAVRPVPGDSEAVALILASAADIEVRIRPRSRRRCYARTASFDILTVSSGDEPPAGANEAVDRLVEAIRANDPGDLRVPRPPTLAGPPRNRTRADHPVLHLVPGHIGCPDDIGGRSMDLIRRAALILVERTKTEHTRNLLLRFGRDPDPTRIVEIPDDAAAAAREVRPLLDALGPGDEACLFGVDEGTTGLCDPGRAVVQEATLPGRGIEVRTVGGPSALAAAVSRTPVRLETFVFLGPLDTEDHLRRMAHRMRRNRKLPAFLYANGRSVRARLPRLLDRTKPSSCSTVTLFDRMTTPEESVTVQPAADFRAPPASALPDEAPVTVLIAPAAAPPWSLEALEDWPFGRTAVRWIRRATDAIPTGFRSRVRGCTPRPNRD